MRELSSEAERETVEVLQGWNESKGHTREATGRTPGVSAREGDTGSSCENEDGLSGDSSGSVDPEDSRDVAVSWSDLDSDG